MNARTVPLTMLAVAVFAIMLTPVGAKQKENAAQFLPLNGNCSIERKIEGQTEDCDKMVMLVVFDDGYLSFQFHSVAKDKTGRYKWVVNFVGPGVSEVPEHGGKMFQLPIEKLAVIDDRRNGKLTETTYHDMGCLLNFADAKNIVVGKITKLTCWYGDNYDKATIMTFTDIKAGT